MLLGDSVELRDDPLGVSLERALPFFEALGEAVGAGRVTIVPGNHDHRLIAPRLKGRRQLGVEQRYDVAPGDPLEAVVRSMGRARVELVYPGLWLRPDVYAMHGHYLDCHSDVRTFECRAAALTQRFPGAPRDGYRSPVDYEAVLAPIYRLIHWSVQVPGVRGAAHAAKRLVRRWERPRTDRAARVAARRRRDGPGGAKPGRGCAARACSGISHRPGRWDAGGGTELVNAGAWVKDASAISPGTCVVVRDEGPPELKTVL